MKSIPLGKKTEFKSLYDPELLFSISREDVRKQNNINLIFKGYDVWNVYELSWLDKKGKPEVRIVRIIYSSDSKNIVESKSLKLYLGSFAMTKFENESEAAEKIKKDLSKILETPYLKITLMKYDKHNLRITKIPNKQLLDTLSIKTETYKINKLFLKKELYNGKIIERYSNLLKTNCPITNQPDWATIYLRYKAKFKITDESLLKYIISYRNHSDFHEATCERVFNDIYEVLNPELLTVKCFYTRRGGIDISPLRYYGEEPDMKFDFHYWRQ